MFCSMTCDPNQSLYLRYNATEDYTSPTGENLTLISALDYYIRDSYVVGMYDSCKEVKNPSSNSLALTSFCGPWGEDCNAYRYCAV